MSFTVGEPQQTGLGLALGGLGSGIGQGISQSIGQRLQSQYETKQNMQSGMALAKAIGKPELGQLLGGLNKDQQKLVIQEIGSQQLSKNISDIYGFGKQSTDNIPSPGQPSAAANISQADFQRMYDAAAPKDKEKILRAYNEQRKFEAGEQKLGQQKELQYIKMNEPKINELQEKVDALENTGTELSRLDDIFKSGKLPSSFTAAMFDLEGESGLSDLGRSQLSEEAQEAVKIIASQIRGISKIFPGRILKTEIDNFMKTLPTLINTPKGKENILRSMRIFNEMATLQGNAILKEFEQSGGPGKILFSEAVSKAHGATKDRINQLREIYLNPDKTDFEFLPPASLYKGYEIYDPETGQTLFSNGFDWGPKKE